MFYHLSKDVFLVRGAKKHCIYDLSKGALYAITDKVYDIIRLLCESESIHSTIFNDKDQLIIKMLLAESLIETSDFIQGNGDAEQKSDASSDIKFAWIEITDRCNLRCIHCYEDASSNNMNELSFENFQFVVNELKKIGVDQLQIIGGEPLLHKDLRDMIAYCRNKFSFLEIFTNATLMNEDWIHFFKQYNVHIAVSVYSYNAQEHDKVTKITGSHDKTVRSLGLLLEGEIPYRIACVHMDGIEVGIRNEAFYDLSSCQDMVRMSGRANLNLLNKEIIKQKMITRETFSSPLDDIWVKNMMHYHNCFSNRLYIAANLEVYPCVMERRFSHGNLQDANLAALIKPEIITLSKDKLESCRDCEYRYACFDCRPDSLTRGIHDKPWYCTYNPYTGEWDHNIAEKILNFTK